MSSPNVVALVVVSWFFFAFASILYCMRMYADVFIVRHLRADSYITFFAFLLLLTSQVFVMLSVNHGMGQHVESLNAVQIIYGLKWGWMAQIFQLLAITTEKIAVIIYLKIFSGNQHMKIKLACLWTLGSLQVISTFIFLAFILTQCSPVHKLWNEGDSGTCNGRIRNQNVAFFQSSLSALTDVCLVMYPAVIFWRLKLETIRRFKLYVVFGASLLAAVCTLSKMSQLHQIGNTNDITYDLAYLIIWNASDMYVVFIAGLIPTLGYFFRKPKPDESVFNCHNLCNTRPVSHDCSTFKMSPISSGVGLVSMAGRDTSSHTTVEVSTDLRTGPVTNVTGTEVDVEAVGIAR